MTAALGSPSRPPRVGAVRGYVDLYATHMRMAIATQLQYRVANYFYMIGMVAEPLNGWSGAELLALMGVHILLGGIIASSIQPNMERLMQDIRRGTLDFLLTKPDDAQLLVSIRDFRPWQTVDVAIGAILVVVGVAQLEHGPGIAEVLAFAAALFLGAVLIYCFWLVVTTCAFWLVRMDEVHELFEGLYQSGRWPISIYPTWLRIGLTFLVPIGFAVTVPAEAVTSRLAPESLAAAAVFTAVAFLLARWFWRLGLRSYSGASA